MDIQIFLKNWKQNLFYIRGLAYSVQGGFTWIYWDEFIWLQKFNNPSGFDYAAELHSHMLYCYVGT